MIIQTRYPAYRLNGLMVHRAYRNYAQYPQVLATTGETDSATVLDCVLLSLSLFGILSCVEEAPLQPVVEFYSLIGWPLWLIVIGSLLSFVAAIWLVIVAFKESLVWGFCVLLIPFAGLIFIIARWQVAQNVFLFTLFAFALFGGGITMTAQKLSADNPELQEFIQKYEEQFNAQLEDAEEQADQAEGGLPEPTPIDVLTEQGLKEMQSRLNQEAAELRQRKAELNPDDQEAVTQLTSEILEYNSRLEEFQTAREKFRSGQVTPIGAVEVP